MSSKTWVVRSADARKAAWLSAELGVSRTLASVLIGRGIEDVATARRFLEPSLSDLHNPSLLPDIDVAVDRLERAIRGGEHILIYGDYDVDGVSATALLVRALQALSARVSYYIPHRLTEGYDFKVESAARAAIAGVDLIITVDCGAVACEAIAEAKRLGIDVIVTDHHRPGPELPPAIAVVNPVRRDSCYPFPGLAGVAVAFKLVCALCDRIGIRQESAHRAFLDLVALGTCADVSPLLDENRILVKFGLKQLASTKKVGLRTLMEQAGIADGEITAWHVGFVLGPRLNAAGRLQDANLSLRLMLTRDLDEAQQIARELEQRNSQRRQEQERILEEAKAQLDVARVSQSRIVVVSGTGWHPGVIGIVASRLVDIYRRPAVVVALDGDTARGSARSKGGFHLVRALDHCRDLLIRYGGHQLAAGFDVSVSNIRALEERLHEVAAEMVSDEDLRDEIEIDAWIPACELVPDLWREVQILEPFGEGNPMPVFASRFLVLGAQCFGKQNEHLRLTVRGDGMTPMEAVYWRAAHMLDTLKPGTEWDFCYRLDVNRYSGYEFLRLVIQDVRPCGSKAVEESEVQHDPFSE